MKFIDNSKYFVAILFLCILVVPSFSLSFQNEPDGFRGHRWGDKFESFRKMTLIVGDPDVEAYIGDADIKAYEKLNDKLIVDGAQVLLIAYYFYKEKLGMITINYETKKNFNKLKKIFDSRHGSGSKSNPYYDRSYEQRTGKKPPSYRKMYWWLGKENYIRLEYIKTNRRGTIIYDYFAKVFKDDYDKGVDAYKRKDYKKALKYFVDIADSGIKNYIVFDVQGYLGYMYDNGYGLNKNYEQAVYYYRKAAEGGHPFGQYRLGWMYDTGNGVEKDYQQAVNWYRKAAEQGYAPGQYNMGSMYEHGAGVQKDIKKAKFWYKKAAEKNIPYAKDALERLRADVYNKRGIAHANKGKYDKAISDFDRAIEIQPKYAKAYFIRGLTYSKKGQYEKAISDFNKAIEINPKNSMAYNNRGMAYLRQAQYDRAILDLSKAIELNPRHHIAYYNRGGAYIEKKMYDKAISDLTKQIEITPGDAHAYNREAWLLATCSDDRYRDGIKAVKLAQKAIELSPHPSYLDTLAAAYAEVGKFADAITIQEKAIAQLKKESKAEPLIDELIERLEYYKGHKPWRD